MQAGILQSDMLTNSLAQAKRLATAVIGFTMLLFGAVMLVMPGPGIVIILLGLSILGAEFVWARNMMRRIRRAGGQIKRSVLPDSEKPADDPTAPVSGGQALRLP